MTLSRRAITIATVLALALGLVVIAWLWLFPPYLEEEDVIALYAAHKKEFVALTRMAEDHCVWQLTPEVRAAARRMKWGMEVYCHYSVVRFVLGWRGLMTIGPEKIIGLTYIPGDPAREGTVVPVIGAHAQEVGDVYMRRIDDHWYVFTQNTE